MRIGGYKRSKVGMNRIDRRVESEMGRIRRNVAAVGWGCSLNNSSLRKKNLMFRKGESTE